MIRRAQPWLGTLVDITITAPDDDVVMAARAIDAAFAVVGLVHRLMSFHDAASDVGLINQLATGKDCRVDAHTARVLRCALLLQEASGGLFDIACADALMAWGQLPVVGNGAAADATGGSMVVLAVAEDNRVIRLREGAIDLGGIAKGYAVDQAVDTLQAAGVTAGIVNAGGDLRTWGAPGMLVAIRDPDAPRRAGRMLQLQDCALATSAGYFSRRQVDGVDTCALVDTRTGRPVLHGRSVSVMAPTCMLADGLTKPIIASVDPRHPVLARFDATAFVL